MSITLKTTLANAWLDSLLDADFPAGSILEIRSGAAAGPDNAAGGTLLAAVTTPATPFAAAASKAKAKNGTWSTTGAAAGNAGHYRLRDAADTKRIEGTVTASGGGGDLTLDNVSIAVGQTVTINTFTFTL